ncbi:MAG: MFS transporter [Chloroflexota bacterium]
MSNLSPAASNLSKRLFVLSTAIYWISLYVYVPILPIYTQQLGGSLAMVGLVVSAYGISQLLLRVPLGIASDRLGRRKPFIIMGTLTAAAGALGFLLADDPWLLFVSRALTGVAASSWVAFTVLFSSYFPAGRAVQAMSLVTFVSGASQVLGTFAGGQIAQHFGIMATFWVGLVLGLTAMVVSLGIKEETRRAAPALTWGQVLGVMTVPSLLLVSFTCVLLQFSAYATTYGFTPVFAEGLGATSADQGTLVTTMIVFATLGQLAAGPLSGRLRERWLVTGGMLLTGATVLAIPLVTSVLVLAILQALGGFGRGLGFPVLMGLSVRAVPQAQRATAMGVFQATYALGMFGGPFVGGLVAGSFGLNAVFFVTAAVCVVAAALGMLIPRQGKGN